MSRRALWILVATVGLVAVLWFGVLSETHDGDDPTAAPSSPARQAPSTRVASAGREPSDASLSHGEPTVALPAEDPDVREPLDAVATHDTEARAEEDIYVIEVVPTYEKLSKPLGARHDRAPDVLLVEEVLLDVACPLLGPPFPKGQVVLDATLYNTPTGYYFRVNRVGAAISDVAREVELQHELREALREYEFGGSRELRYDGPRPGPAFVAVDVAECESR